MKITKAWLGRSHLVVATLLLLLYALAGCAPAFADRTCTDAESADGDKWLFLNKRDTAASIDKNLPWGIPTQNVTRLLVHWDYIIGYQDSLRVPLWTAYRLDARGLNTVPERVNCFRRDVRIPTINASLPVDYDENTFDQGHLAPSEDMSHSLRQNVNSFIMSNMTPQYGAFNRVIWARLEAQGRTWARRYRSVFVISGSIFDNDGNGEPDADSVAKRMKSRNGKKRVAIPSHFFKIIVRDCGDGHLASIAFVLPNDKKSRTGSAGLQFLDESRRPIAAIESLTGLNLFPNATDAMLDKTSTSVMWPLQPLPKGSPPPNCATDQPRNIP